MGFGGSSAAHDVAVADHCPDRIQDLADAALRLALRVLIRDLRLRRLGTGEVDVFQYLVEVSGPAAVVFLRFRLAVLRIVLFNLFREVRRFLAVHHRHDDLLFFRNAQL